jgi:hypothetical protein
MRLQRLQLPCLSTKARRASGMIGMCLHQLPGSVQFV